MARKTTRLYYGLHAETGKRLYWTLKVRNSTKSVKLNGTVEDAMTGGAGVSIGCHLSNTAKNNRDKFGHPPRTQMEGRRIASAIGTPTATTLT
jgi:polyisoprenoid-binding protein YceI